VARGISRWGGAAVARSDSLAATVGGIAISKSDAYALGRFGGLAESDSTSTATSIGGVAVSDGSAVSDGIYGGRAVSVSDSLADTFGGVSHSQVRAVSGATQYGSAISDGVGVSISGPRRTSQATVWAEGRAYRMGRSRSSVSAVEIRQ
jgi:hypothetical protein